MDSIFLFDIVAQLYKVVREPILKGHSQARDAIGKEFGSPITDIEGHREKHKQLTEIQVDLRGLSKISENGDVGSMF
ncbi:hypothetical protein [Ruegeria sp. EL01]|jgi:hypothetical protein|uniref:hypothetical protein n=1 Tax=Ruegeria sp. EL01 TaxID=2107578 RepID=UPI000EA7FE37|nr:hypothetical protein [Ruegeria sp. EL01]